MFLSETSKPGARLSIAVSLQTKTNDYLNRPLILQSEDR